MYIDKPPVKPPFRIRLDMKSDFEEKSTFSGKPKQNKKIRCVIQNDLNKKNIKSN